MKLGTITVTLCWQRPRVRSLSTFWTGFTNAMEIEMRKEIIPWVQFASLDVTTDTIWKTSQIEFAKTQRIGLDLQEFVIVSSNGRQGLQLLYDNFYLFAATKCPDLQQPRNGMMECVLPKSSFFVDSYCQFSCNAGYFLLGSNTTRCLTTGVWSDPVALCKRKLCNCTTVFWNVLWLWISSSWNPKFQADLWQKEIFPLNLLLLVFFPYYRFCAFVFT